MIRVIRVYTFDTDSRIPLPFRVFVRGRERRTLGLARAKARTLVFITLAILVLAGFGFRVAGLSAEGLSEDELNKLNAVADYRANGLTGANGEHPMLMKALQATSIILSEKWNGLVGPENQIAPETALRLPGTIAGALSAILIY